MGKGILNTETIPAATIQSVQADPLRWHVVQTGIQCLGYSVIAIGVGCCLSLLGMTIHKHLPSFGYLQTPLALLGLVTIILGGFGTIVGLLHCVVVPDPTSRVLVLVVLTITLYSAHYGYSMHDSIARTRTQIASHSRSFSRPKADDNNLQQMMADLHASYRSTTVLSAFGNSILMAFFISLMCIFDQKRIIQSIQKLFIFQIGGLITLLLVILGMVALFGNPDAGETSLMWALFIGFAWLAYAVISLYLYVRIALSITKVIHKARTSSEAAVSSA